MHINSDHKSWLGLTWQLLASTFERKMLHLQHLRAPVKLEPISNGSVQLQSLFSLSSWEETFWLQLSGQSEVANRFIYNSNFCALPGSLIQGKNLGLAAIPRKKRDTKFSLSYIKDFQSLFVKCKVSEDFSQRREYYNIGKYYNTGNTVILVV